VVSPTVELKERLEGGEAYCSGLGGGARLRMRREGVRIRREGLRIRREGLS
jgi:hypothetical protein